MKNDYDLIVIGAGPGGMASVLRASELGIKACLIEKELIGGTCLNWGCIPTKTIEQSVNLLSRVRRAPEFGVNIDMPLFDITAVTKRKDEVVSKLRNGAETMLKSKNIDLIFSDAGFIDANTVKTKDSLVSAKNIIIATGSVPVETDALKMDNKTILSSKDMLALEKLPKSLTVIGGGFIGCEFASMYSRLGVEVTIIELTEGLLPGFDREAAKRLENAFKKNNINVLKGEKVTSLTAAGDKAKACLENGREINSQKVLLCIGRRPNISNLGLENAGIKTEKGAVSIEESLRTSAPNIYAIGDVTGRFFLAHVASYEGRFAVDIISGKQAKPDYSAVPSAIFTSPELASVGLTARQAEEQGVEAEVVKLPFTAVSKAHIMGQTEGFIKLVTDKKTKNIIGALILGASASELISNFTIAIRNSLTVKAISETIFAHPTLSEGALDVSKRAGV